MDCGIVKVAAALTAAAALLGAPSALAATPQQIYRDFVAHGSLTGNYSAADLRAALSDSTLEGYPYNSPGGQQLRTQIQQKLAGPSRSGVLGAGKTIQRAAAPAQVRQAAGPLATTKAKSGTLPFTGIQLGILAIV